MKSLLQSHGTYSVWLFLTFGLNGFLHFIPMPPPTGVAAQFFGASFRVRVLRGDFSVADRTRGPVACKSVRASALTILVVVIANILCFHIFMAPAGLPMAVVVRFMVSYDLERAVGVCGDPSTLAAFSSRQCKTPIW